MAKCYVNVVLSHPLLSGSTHFSFSLTLIKDFLGENAEAAETSPPSERGTHSDNSLSDADLTNPLLALMAFGAKLFHVKGINPQLMNSFYS